MSLKIRSPESLVVLVCAAQVFVQIGSSFWPALLPGMMTLWQLSNSEAGWITAIFFGAYMVAVPVLVPLTDRFDTRSIYLLGVALTVVGHLLFATVAEGFWSALFARALAGIGWAGTYMTGLKLLADRVEGKLMSRATAGHAASIGISGALSFAIADLITNVAGWRAAFLAGSISAAIAWLLIAIAFPRQPRKLPAQASKPAVFDFRPVFRNRSAMAYAVTYCIHTFEFHAVRGWGVVFLAFVAGATSSEAIISPPMALTLLGLIATVSTVMGNEAAIRFGRRQLIGFALLASAACAAVLGIWGPTSYLLAVAILLLYGGFISLDSASLTAGAAGSATPDKRGATLAVHSTLGYAGGFVGPLVVGWILDFAGGRTPAAWAAAYLTVAAIVLAALVIFALMRPSGLAGDRAQ
ncbi:MAG: MFS transporter [Xanthobacteraceae bacterium]|nr:MFS transporter [Xanthobacteraceae bacterium]